MKYKRWTQEEIDFVRKCRKKKMTYRKIAEKLELIYGRKASPQNIARFCMDTFSKGWKHWTIEETELLASLKEEGFSYREIALKLNRTPKSVQTKYHKMFQKRLVLVPNEPEPTPEPKEKKWAKNRCNYTPQQELGIMVDFPNLSIDEMREKYQRDYRALAARYESIWDSTEEARISLLKEASLIIEARKREAQERAEKEATEPRMGWFERRKMRRVARKAAKIQKRLDRMATKYGAILTNGDD